MSRQLRGVQIIRTGEWTGSAGKVPFTTGDLEAMVRSFYELNTQAGFQPHIKLGHEEAQRFFGQREGFPSLGIVDRVWREGDVVYADFSNVPEPIVDLIAQRRYTQVSVEIYPEYEYEGRKFKNVLAAVALLGAELPAVKGLRDLADALYSEGKTAFSEDKGKLELTMTTKTEEKDGVKPEPKPEGETVSTAAFNAQADRLKSVETALETERNERAAERVRIGKAAIKTFVEAAVKEGRLLPKNQDAAIAFAETLIPATTKVSFKEGDKTIEYTQLEAFERFVGGLGKAVDFSERGTGKSTQEDTNAKPAGQIVDERANALVKDKKAENYHSAVAIVLSELDADTKQRYVEGR